MAPRTLPSMASVQIFDERLEWVATIGTQPEGSGEAHLLIEPRAVEVDGEGHPATAGRWSPGLGLGLGRVRAG